MGLNPHNFNLRKLNLISGESKLLTKQILLSKYWIEDGELEIVENTNLDNALKSNPNEVVDDNEVHFELGEENIDLTDNLDTTRMDFTGMAIANVDNAMPDEVFGGDAMMEQDDMLGNSQLGNDRLGGGDNDNDKDKEKETVNTLNNPGVVGEDVNKADNDN